MTYCCRTIFFVCIAHIFVKSENATYCFNNETVWIKIKWKTRNAILSKQIPLTHMIAHFPFFLQEKSGGVKLVLWDHTFPLSGIIRSYTCLCVTCE